MEEQHETTTAETSNARAIIIGACVIALALFLGLVAFPRYERLPDGWRDRWTGDRCHYFMDTNLCAWTTNPERNPLIREQ